MRNLKKALALALASVMLMGMMVVGTGATFADVDDSHNVEAIEVLKTVGVMIGDGDNFNPDKAVSRNEMAVIMTNLLQLDTADYSGTTPFTDVPAWAEPFVAACYANGIVTGTSATTFGGDAGVTATQAALMVMKALGYFQYASDFGSDWQLATVKQADKIDLFDGIDAKVTATLTRNEAAQLVLNALKADMVEVSGQDGIVVEGEGFTVVTGSTVSYDVVTKVADTKWDNIDATKDGARDIIQLGEKLFDGKLALGTGTDDFGRPAAVWTYTNKGETTTITAADAADYSFVVTGTKNDTLAEILDSKDLELNEYDATNHYFVGTVGVNGTITELDETDTTATSVVLSTYTSLPVGTVVELFTNTDGDVDGLVFYTYQLAKISKISAAAADADYDYLVSFKTIADSAYGSFKDTKIAGFDADEFAKDDVVVVVYKDATELLYIAKADTVSGKMTAKGSDYIKVDGKKLPVMGGYSFISDYTDEYTFYLDPNGFVMDEKAITETSTLEYVFVKDAEVYGSKSTLKADDAAKALAKVVFMDGTEKTVELWVKKAAEDLASADMYSGQDVNKDDWYVKHPADGKAYKITNTAGTEDTGVSALYAGGFYTYTIKDGMYVLSDTLGDTDVTATEYISDGNYVSLTKETAAITGTNSFTATSKTVVTVIDEAVKTYTGIKNFTTTAFEVDTDVIASVTSGRVGVDGILTLVEDGYVTNVFVIGGTAVDEANWAYFVEAGDTNADGTAYNGYVAGADVSYIYGSALKGLYDVEVEDGEVKTAVTTNVAYGTVKTIDDTFVVLENGTLAYFADSYKIYNISGDFTGEETDLAEGDVIAYGTNAGEIEVIYVIDAPEVKDVVAHNSTVSNATQAAGADDTLEFVQVGTEITISGGYATGDYLYFSFDGENYIYADRTDMASDADGKFAYTTTAGEAGAAFTGITVTFDFSSALGA